MKYCFFVALLLCSASLFAQVPADIDVLDRTVMLDDIKLHASVTKPKTPGRHPAVLVISGLGCYALPQESSDPFNQFRFGLTRRGFVTMWVEKNGEGSSQGPACDSPQSDLQFAASRSVAGLKALAAYDFVDSKNIFIFAHSIGPLEGVLVAGRFPVRGFIAAETIGTNWFQYQLENTRRQLLLLGWSYDAVEKAVRITARCQYHFSIEKQMPEQIVKADPECKDSVGTYSVSAAYLQQIADLNLAAEWKKIDVPVLVTWGTSDALTSADEGRYLADMINSFHPGRAAYEEFKEMGHGLDLWPSQKVFLESFRKKHDAPFDTEFLQQIADWLKQNVATAQGGQ